NPLTEMIKHKYPRLFESVHQGLIKTWPNFQFPESEIAFIVLHFGGAIQKQATSFYKVFVVCSSGIGTSRLLATRLQQTFSEIQQTTKPLWVILIPLIFNNMMLLFQQLI